MQTSHLSSLLDKRLLLLLTGLFSVIVVTQYISVFTFVVCVPTAWDVQRRAAQEAIDQIGPGFYPVDVWSSEDSTSRYQTNGRGNRAVTFFFAHAKPSGSDAHAPYPYYSVRINDRDPFKSVSVEPGVAYGSMLPLQTLAEVFGTTQLSPSDAVIQLNRQLPERDRLGEPLVVLILNTTVAGIDNRPAMWRILAPLLKQSYYVDAATGRFLGIGPKE